MLIIPAVDIKGGKCVRLEQGAMDRETVFSEHPEQMALQWERKGAKKLHLVDLDGAVAGRPVNKKAIQGITERLSIPVELGGGIRSLDAIEEYIDLGIHEVIIGSAAYKDPDLVHVSGSPEGLSWGLTQGTSMSPFKDGRSRPMCRPLRWQRDLRG